MVENSEESSREELIFFDTFSHDLHEVSWIKTANQHLGDAKIMFLQKLNLDLVQFTNPVYISEIRIIPLGARVQADFPGMSTSNIKLASTKNHNFQVVETVLEQRIRHNLISSSL